MSASAAAASAPPDLRLVPVPRPGGRLRLGTSDLSLAPPAPTNASSQVWPDDDDEPATPAPDVERLPDPRRWTALLAQAVVEILAGRRPPAQVVRWTDPEIYERIRRSAPATPSGPHGAPVRVRRVRVSTTPEGIVEAVAVIDDGHRCRAMAVRLEPLQRRWMCTALDLV